jgi:hypothetical protein
VTDAHVPAEPEEWLASTDEEHWSCSVSFATREAAIVAGPAELDLQPGERFFVGLKAAPKTAGRDWADEMCEAIALDACDEVDSDLVGLWPNPTTEQRQELTAEVQRLLDAWLARHQNLRPGFFLIDDVTEHEAPEQLADGSPVA